MNMILLLLLASFTVAYDFSFSAMTQVQDQFQIGAPGYGGLAWLGADVDFSTPLWGDTVLWVFGDTLIGSLKDDKRSFVAMPRNSIALSTVQDGELSQLTFYWRNDSNLATSTGFFTPNDTASNTRWFWVILAFPSADQLHFLALYMEQATGAFPFATICTTLISVTNPTDDPMDWQSSQYNLPNTDQVGLTSGVFLDSDYAYLVGQNLTQGGSAALARILLSSLQSSTATGLQLEWWLGANNWGAFRNPLPALFYPSASEGSLAYQPTLGMYYIFSLAFYGTEIEILLSPSIEGPYVRLPFFSIPPPWNNTTLMFCYAVKAHPELATDTEIAFSFVCNTLGLTQALVSDLYIYQPQFYKTDVSSFTELFTVDKATGQSQLGQRARKLFS